MTIKSSVRSTSSTSVPPSSWVRVILATTTSPSSRLRPEDIQDRTEDVVEASQCSIGQNIFINVSLVTSRYPPFDPFNTTYIPLPGPSSPHYALKLQGDNPHMNEKARFISFRLIPFSNYLRHFLRIYLHIFPRRPIRQSRKLQKGEVLPKMFQNLHFKSSDLQPTSDPFKYKSSGTFEKTQFFQSFLSKVPK